MFRWFVRNFRRRSSMSSSQGGDSERFVDAMEELTASDVETRDTNSDGFVDVPSPNRAELGSKASKVAGSCDKPVTQCEDGSVNETGESVREEFRVDESKRRRVDPTVRPAEDERAKNFQTPDRRTKEVDSKTIPRPKSSMPLPEIFSESQLNASASSSSMTTVSQSAVSLSPIPLIPPGKTAQPAATVTQPTAQPAATVTQPTAQPAATVTQPTAQPAATVTQPTAPVPSSNASSVAKPIDDPAAALRREERKTRSRQQTVTVSGHLTRDMKNIFEELKKSVAEDAKLAEFLTLVEGKVMPGVIDREKEFMAKSDKLGQMMVGKQVESEHKERQLRADLEFQSAIVSDLEKALKQISAEKAMNGGIMTSSMEGMRGNSAVPRQGNSSNPVDLATIDRLKREKEGLETENSTLSTQYKNLYRTFEMQRTAMGGARERAEQLEQQVRELTEKVEETRSRATRKLNEANSEIEKLSKVLEMQAKAHKEDTYSLRIRLRQKEGESEEYFEQLERRKKEVADLKDICNELLAKHEAPGSDVE